MHVSARERKILEHLLDTQKNTTVKEIAEMLNVSERTAHRDLKNIEALVADFELKLVRKTGVGIQLIGQLQAKQRLKMELMNMSTTEFSPDERRAIILSTLLEANGPVKLYALANEMNVTIATVSNDLDQMDAELQSNKLAIVRKRGYGVEISGDEAAKRSAITNMIATFLNPFDYIALVKENIQQKAVQPLNAISNRLLGLINPKKLQTIEKLVQQAKTQLPHDLADSAYIGLIVHLALAIERLQKGDTITFDQPYLHQLEDTKEFDIASGMIRELEESFAINIPDDEIGYITMHLLGAKLRNGKDYLLEDPSIDVAFKAKSLIRFVSNYIDLDLTHNNQLLNDLVAHLKPTMFRLAKGMNIKNPMTVEIKQDYDDLFHLIADGVKKVFPDLNFPDDEVAYLVLHFAAVILYGENKAGLKVLVLCSTGIGSAKILATRLKQYIPEIKQVDNKSMLEIEKTDTDHYDLILSTIPLKDFDRNKYILVSPMLNKEEVHRVKKAIRKYKVTIPYEKTLDRTFATTKKNYSRELKGMERSLQAILNVLDYFTIIKITNRQSVPSILKLACLQLEKDGRITAPDAVLKELLKREKVGGLGIPETSMALYHMRSNDIRKPTFLICDLENPLDIKGMDGKRLEMNRLMIMLAPQDTNHETLEAISFLSSAIIQSKGSIKLFESGEIEEIRDFLSEQFYRFMQND
ncbi:BglG family transcription antiterminator [Lederbergia sp. NSJ-179]|uniref:BglG family transcription antiterminator n=1 Tax=Lederbergia sp. NSJ-179 TaxID=2931402 RepID=UPI001FD25EED|nr:BglG family transcription antiterminator [Lederbergia sp. NSJ-179]MCJ7842260.1 BglG family transcription antiterminator [Lederbergia sp. NSJ-179]